MQVPAPCPRGTWPEALCAARRPGWQHGLPCPFERRRMPMRPCCVRSMSAHGPGALVAARAGCQTPSPGLARPGPARPPIRTASQRKMRPGVLARVPAPHRMATVFGAAVPSVPAQGGRRVLACGTPSGDGGTCHGVPGRWCAPRWSTVGPRLWDSAGCSQDTPHDGRAALARAHVSTEDRARHAWGQGTPPARLSHRHGGRLYAGKGHRARAQSVLLGALGPGRASVSGVSASRALFSSCSAHTFMMSGMR